MARVNGLLEDVEGQLNGLTLYKRNGKTFVRPSHIRQPHRLSRKQLLLRERQSHNNALWRALVATKMVFFEGEKPPYYRFMALNLFSPVPYLEKRQYHSGHALLLPNMVLSDGPLPPISYQLGDVDGQPALLTDLTKKEARKDTLLLYVLHQTVITYQNWSTSSILVSRWKPSRPMTSPSCPQLSFHHTRTSVELSHLWATALPTLCWVLAWSVLRMVTPLPKESLPTVLTTNAILPRRLYKPPPSPMAD